MTSRTLGLFVIILLFQSVSCSAQSTRRDSTLRFFGVPLLFYTPDTRWGVGAAGILTFPTRPLRSSVTFNFSYTQNRQILIFLPFSWFGNQNRWRAYGELGWYRYLYQYFGIGNRVPNDYIETYTARFPRIRITAAKRLKAPNSLGIRFFLDDFHIVSASEGGEIANKVVPGARGGVSSSVGPVWVYDSRDNAFFPRKGWLAEGVVTADHRLTGSDFAFVRCSLDVARYFSWGKTVVAAHAIAIFTAGDTPFFQLPQLGGPRRLRGYPDGKYRDRHLLMAQAEWRFPLFWRLKGVVFGGGGTVTGRPGENARFRPNAGAGLRIEFDRRQKLHLRIDYGIGKGAGNSGFYATVGEAF
jgi:outer membrane protein assembly factor BamA